MKYEDSGVTEDHHERKGTSYDSLRTWYRAFSVFGDLLLVFGLVGVLGGVFGGISLLSMLASNQIIGYVVIGLGVIGGVAMLAIGTAMRSTAQRLAIDLGLPWQ